MYRQTKATKTTAIVRKMHVTKTTKKDVTKNPPLCDEPYGWMVLYYIIRESMGNFVCHVCYIGSYIETNPQWYISQPKKSTELQF